MGLDWNDILSRLLMAAEYGEAQDRLLGCCRGTDVGRGEAATVAESAICDGPLVHWERKMVGIYADRRTAFCDVLIVEDDVVLSDMMAGFL